MSKADYLAKLRDPRWQKMRLQVLERDDWACQACFDGESTLHVHHRIYHRGREPWEYKMDDLVTLCESCHAAESDGQRESDAAVLSGFRANLELLNDDMAKVAEALACVRRPMPPEASDFVESIVFLCRLSYSRAGLNLGVIALAELCQRLETEDAVLGGNMQSLFGALKMPKLWGNG